MASFVPHSLMLLQVHTTLNLCRETPGLKSGWNSLSSQIIHVTVVLTKPQGKAITVVLKMQVHLLAVPQHTWNNLDFIS